MATELRLQLVARPALIAKVAPTFTKNIVAGTGIGVSYTSPTYTINLDIAALTTDPAILTTEIANIYAALYDASSTTYAKASLSVIRDAIISGGAGLGDVVGPSSSTDNAAVRFDGATGKIIQNSAVIIDDSNNVSGVGTLASGAHAITSASANALAVGLTGATNPALKVDASAATSVTGIKVSSAATGGGAFLAAIGDVNTQLNIDAAGSGTIRLADTSTGAVEFGTNAVPQTSDGAALGTTALKWSDAFLASGAVLNFDSGDVTVTHAANTLTFAGATSGYQFGEIIAPSANDGAPIGSATLQWSDLFLASGAVINFDNGNAVLTHSAGILTVSTGDLRVTTAGTNAASAVTVGGTQTLTAKTLTAPVLSGATAHGVLYANGTGVITATAEMTNGQILIGTTGGDPVPRTVGTDATLSAAGALTIANDAVTYAKMQNVSVTARILGRTTAGAGDVEECTLTQVLDFIGSAAQGDILFRGATDWSRLGAGTTGQFLKTLGAGGNPQWSSIPGGGDLLSTNNLTDVANAATSLANLGGLAILNAGAVPQGRLTLTTATPVMTATVSAATTIYYTPYVGNIVSIYDGTKMVPTVFTELSQATTDATKSPAAVAANSNYDLFVWNDAGTIRCTRGPAWTSGTARGTGAGTTELVRVLGFLLNANAITNGPAAQRGTYVGTVRSNASSQIDWIFGASGVGGTAGVFGVWNTYNRVTVSSSVTDSTDSWTYATATWRSLNNSNGNRHSAVFGLAEDGILLLLVVPCIGTAGAANAYVGISEDAIAQPAQIVGFTQGTYATLLSYHGTTSLGYHFWQAVEYSSGATSTFYGEVAPVRSGLNFNARM